MRLVPATFFLAFILCGGVLAEPATTVLSTKLYASPVFGKPPIGSIPGKISVDVITNKRLWCEIRQNELKGWVKCFSLKMDSQPIRHSVAEESSGGSVVSTIGIRGLNASDLKAAEPSKDQFNAMVSYAVDSETASESASKRGLLSRSIDYLTKVKDASDKPKEQSDE